MRVAGYYRVSSEEQRQRQSIKSQREPVEAYALSALKVKLVKEYPDDGINGSVPLERRPEGRKLIEDAKNGVFDTLVVWKLNRIGRGGVYAILKALKMLHDLGVRVISLHEQINTSTALGEMMVAMTAFAGRLEKDSLRTNVINGQLRVAREGKWTRGRPPFGYRVGAEGRLAIHEDQAKIVQRVFALYLGGFGYYEIALTLNREGVPPPSHWLLEPNKRKKDKTVYRGKKAPAWNTNVVENILTRSDYTGVY